MAEGTRTVTVLFTDLVGSTVLSQRVDVQTADSLRATHFGQLRSEAESVGGTVVKNLGDGVMVVFDTPTAALVCAVGMQQVVDRSNRGAEHPLAMRVGLAFGEVTESDGDFFGDPVVEAARICAAAVGGQIIATDVVRAVAGRRVAQSLVSIGPLELKGLSEPVECVEVRWEPTPEPDRGVPLQRHLTERSGASTFVGRGEELDAIRDALKRSAVERSQQLVLVGGEPGIGKTTLATVFARRAHADGAVVLYGRCDEDLGIPYQPWAEALGHLIDHAPPGMLDEVLTAHGADLAHLGPALSPIGKGGGGGSADPETGRYLLFGAIVRILGATGVDHPVAVVLDDLQWADAPTLQVLRHLMTSDQRFPIVVVGTYRESEVRAGDPLADLLAWSHGQPSVTRLGLRGLDDTDLLALMEAAAGHSVDESGLALRDALSRETDGNPFFVFELLRHLIETGAVYQNAEGRWTASGDVRRQGLPISVREVIGRRAARLGDEAVRILSVAAVIGRDFDLDLLARAADTGEDALLEVLDTAVAATLVVNVVGERYSFVHALVGHALYETLSPARRARAHRRVADAIEAICGADPGPRVGELAYHWAQALAPQDAAKAISYARAAGDRALAQLAPDEALRWYRQALGLLDDQERDDPRLRAALGVGIGNAQRQTGDPEFGRTLLEAGRLARQVGDGGTVVAAALANNRGLFSVIGRVDHDRVEMIEAALASIGDVDSAPRARLLALLAIEHTWDGDYPGRRALSDNAVAMARRLGDPATLRDVLLLRHNTIWVPETVAERLQLTAEAETLAQAVGDPVGRFWSAIYRYCPAVQIGDRDEVTRCWELNRALAAQIGQPTLLWMSAWFDTIYVQLSGDVARAEQLAAETYQIGSESGQPDAVLIYAGAINAVRFHQGREAELVNALASSVAANPGLPFIRSALARTFVDLGRVDDARQLLAAEVDTDFPLPHDPGLLSAWITWAEVASRLGDVVAARMLYERLTPWPEQVVFNGSVIGGAIAHYLGQLATVLGRYDTAEEHFSMARTLHERLQAPFHHARTHLEWARMLVVRARPADGHHARTHLDTAIDLARRYGCALVEQQASELLALCSSA